MKSIKIRSSDLRLLNHQVRAFSVSTPYFETKEYDLAVIGAGPGGYVAAIKGAQLGLKTVSIEKRSTLGGTCLNVGCIPSKAMLNNSHLYHQILHDTKKRGIDVKNVELNLPQMLKAKDKSVSDLTSGIAFLYKKNKVDWVKGSAQFKDAHTLDVKGIEGQEDVTISAKNIIVATGSEATQFPGLEFDEKRIVSSTGALDFKEVPQKLIIIGGGIIGLELGSVWSRLGSEVTVVEFLDSVGAGMDAEVAKAFTRIITKQGLKLKTSTKVLSGKVENEQVMLEIEGVKNGKKETLTADACLVAIGRRPYTGGLAIENIGLKTDEKGRLEIDDQYRSPSHPHIRIIGDVTYGPMLAHKAEEEGIAAVEYIVRGEGHVNYNAIPSVMYTHPEVAWVGQTEEQVKKAGIEYNKGTFPFTANSRAKTNQETDGMVKFIAEKETDRILGIHIIGSNAGEMIAEGVLAMEYGASSEDVSRTCHAHPTLSEAFKEAAMATHSSAIHA